MGFTDWFRRQATSSPAADLLGALIDAVEHRDANRLMALVNQNKERIKAEFATWTNVPAPIRGDQEALGRYVNTLLTLATLFERSGDRSLKDWLEGRGRGDNPMTQWTSTIERADRLISEGKSAEAVPLLMASLDQLRGVSGTAVAHFHPRLLGRLGQALREVGDKDEAIRVTREALDLCKQTGDGEGVQVYTRNLQTLGAPEFAQSLGDAGFHIVFCDADDRVLSPDEVSVASGTIRFEVRSGRKIHPEAQRLHEEGRATGGRGDHTGAIALFNQAAAIEPAWPYPVYDRAFAHLIMREFDAALVDYRKVLELAPKGFYVAAQAADLLTREAAGEFPAGLYLAFAMLEHIPKEQQQSIAEQFVERFPSHAPAWNLLANGIQDPSAKLTAIERGLAARPDPDTRGSLLILKASSLHALGQTTSALELLESLREAPDSLSTQATATISAAAVRSSLTSASAPSHRLAPDDHS